MSMIKLRFLVVGERRMFTLEKVKEIEDIHVSSLHVILCCLNHMLPVKYIILPLKKSYAVRKTRSLSFPLTSLNPGPLLLAESGLMASDENQIHRCD